MSPARCQCPRLLLLLVVVVVVVPTARAGEHCDDFEDASWGTFWQPMEDSGTWSGDWKVVNYEDILSKPSDFPPPPHGKEIVSLQPLNDEWYMGADLGTSSRYVFPEGSSVSFNCLPYSKLRGTGRISVSQYFSKDEVVSLRNVSTENKLDWQLITVQINADNRSSQVSIKYFGFT